MNDTGTGMSNYGKILANARIEGHQIGPKHFMYDKHFKEWESKQPVLNQPTPVIKSIGNRIIASVSVPLAPTMNDLKRKSMEERIRKIAEGLKVIDKTDSIKSVGNGL